LIAFTLLPVSGVLIARFGKSLRKTSRLGQAKMSDLYTLIQETIVGAPVVKAFQREDYERDRFRRENGTYFDIYMKNARVESLSSPVMEMVGAVGMGVILWFGGRDVVNHVWTTGAFFAFIGSALSLYQPVKNFSRSNATLQQAFSGAERIFQLMDERPTVKEKVGAAPLPPFSRRIEFDNVSFSYRPDRPVLQEVVNISCEPGRSGGAGGSVGVGENDAVVVADAVLRRSRGSGSHRRQRHSGCDVSQFARPNRAGNPGNTAVQRHHSRQHRVRARRRDRTGNHCRGPSGQRLGIYSRQTARTRHDDRREGIAFVRRAKTAVGHCPGDLKESAHFGVGRSHQLAWTPNRSGWCKRRWNG
jgi:hypothetical protein